MRRRWWRISSCRGKLAKLGEDVTKTLEVIPRQWKGVRTVRERFTCRACESITQPPAPCHPIARGHVGPELLAMTLEAKFGQHLPPNRQGDTYARQGVEIDVSTMADWAELAKVPRGQRPVQGGADTAGRVHGDDTTVPVLAKDKTATGRRWTYVRDDQPFGGPDPPAAMLHYARDRRGGHPNKHLAG